MVKIQINGKAYEVNPGKNLLETCISLGFDIPYFCFHPMLGSVGACRQCAVKKYSGPNDKEGKIVMSCMEPIAEGLVISTDDPDVKAFRAAVIEGLMTNHPHDCPICDEGGECHLQDMTVMTGHNYRRFNFKKRTYNNQYLGPFIQHEMNRCIQCYRCVRFYRNYAGGTDLDVFGAANRIYFGRHRDGVLENEFSGNLVEICPTGVFTDKTLKDHYARKWDLTNSPSVCVHCSLGCNTLVSERYGTVRRILSRYNSSVNGYLLCDRGRFGYEFLNDPDRVSGIKVRTERNGALAGVSGEEYHLALTSALSGKKILGIGSPRASLESNYALEILVGKENFYSGLSVAGHKLVKEAVRILKSGIAHSPSLMEVEKSDAVFIFGEDVTKSAPLLALAVRQASRNKSFQMAEKSGIPVWNDSPVRELAQKIKSPLFIGTPFGTKLDDLAQETFRSSPGELARLGFAVASAIDKTAPVPENMDESLKERAGIIAASLLGAENPLIITGTGNHDIMLLHSAANIALALTNAGRKPSLSLVFPECNSAGAGLMDGKPLDDLIKELDRDEVDTVIILENDLSVRADKETVDKIFNKTKSVIVLDHLLNETSKRAHILIPSGTFAESTGTIINNEGRAQRYYRVLPENSEVKDSWKHLAGMINVTGGKNLPEWQDFDDIVSSFVDSYPFFAKVKEILPDSEFRYFNEKIARQTLRFSGRTAMDANITVSEPKPPPDNDSALAFSMEGFKGITPSDLTPYYWSPGWNSVQAMNKYPDEKNAGDRIAEVLLFSKKAEAKPAFFSNIPAAKAGASGEILIVPVSLIFGSEELSSKSRYVKELIPEPFITLNKKEIMRLGLSENKKIKLFVGKTLLSSWLRIDDTLPDGVAGLSELVEGMPWVGLPATGKIEKEAED